MIYALAHPRRLSKTRRGMLPHRDAQLPPCARLLENTKRVLFGLIGTARLFAAILLSEIAGTKGKCYRAF